MIRGSISGCAAAVSVLLAFSLSNVALGEDRGLASSQGDPFWQEVWRVILLKDYNTRIVVFGVTVLGGAAGLVGCYTLLRKRALMGDAISHATFPGLCLAFMFANYLGWDGKSLPILLTGATISGVLGVLCILLIRNFTRLKEDTAMGAILSVFFGAGIALSGLVQNIRSGNKAGLEGFIYGKTASMGSQDAMLIAMVAGICFVGCIILYKELKLLCFDDQFAGSRGFPVPLLDLALMAMVIVVTTVGLQAVGLILIIALMVIPAAAARFWTQRLWSMLVVSGILGLTSGMLGAQISAIFPRLPSGATIVLVCSLIFGVSLFLGSDRGLLVRYLRRVRLNRSVGREHLLRALYEILEVAGNLRIDRSATTAAVSIEQLLSKRSWNQSQLSAEIRRAEIEGLVIDKKEGVGLTAEGLEEAARLTRQHRLWEIYLIRHADVATGVVDREADAIEHVLEPEIIAELEAVLVDEETRVPVSPHGLGQVPSPSSHGEGK